MIKKGKKMTERDQSAADNQSEENHIEESQAVENKKEKYIQSNIKITKDLKEYDEFKFKEIENRGNKFSSMALHIWKLN